MQPLCRRGSAQQRVQRVGQDMPGAKIVCTVKIAGVNAAVRLYHQLRAAAAVQSAGDSSARRQQVDQVVEQLDAAGAAVAGIACPETENRLVILLSI